MKHIYISYLFFSILGMATVSAQDTDMLLNHDAYNYLDRIDVRQICDTTIHTDLKPIGRNYFGKVFAKIDTLEMTDAEARWHERMRIIIDDDFADNIKSKGIIFGKLYKNKRDFYHYHGKDFRVYLNPLMYMSAGGEIHNYEDGKFKPRFLSTNTRGVVIRGSVFNKIGFYTEVSENLMIPQYFAYKLFDKSTAEGVRESFWGESYVKSFKNNEKTKDFFGYRAYMTYSPIKQIRIKAGYDKAFWGNGYNSLFVSDNPANCLSLDIVSRIWKLEYVNRYTQMLDFYENKNDKVGTYPRKYGVFHQLNFKPSPNFSFGAFESVIYNPYSPNGTRGFELQYLNPIIFYRGVEQMLGSSDNALLGFHLKWNFVPDKQIYAQFLLDDMDVQNAKQLLHNQRGAWTSKTGYQIGMRFTDLFMQPSLDLQIEFNNVRPYVYQHYNVTSNYAHYGQTIGYGWGANARNLDVILRYHPFPQWQFEGIATYGLKGVDTNGINYGGNVMIPYTINYPSTNGVRNVFGNFVGQGVKTQIAQLYGRATYQIFKTDMYFDGEFRVRQEGKYTSAGAWLSFRANMAPRRAKF